MAAQAERSVAPSKGQSWHWPPRPFTIAAVGCVLAIAFIVNFPAVEAPHADLKDGTYGLHFDIAREYEHGWPACYARRELGRPSNVGGPLSAWRPWEGVSEWSVVNLLVDLGLWSLVLIVTGAGAQYWRSRRRAIWQLDLRDLLLLTGTAGLVCAWVVYQRSESLHEQKLLAIHRARGQGGPAENLDARVPLFLPANVQDRYRSLFARVCNFTSDGDSDLACQFQHLVTLSERNPRPDLAEHLRQMPQLEALYLSYANLPYFDATRQTTILHDVPPLPNLRGINLFDTNVTDADMQWLAACPRLEVIELSETSIGDHGLAHLARLPRLRRLTISSDRISDRGCRSIANMPALEELSLASRNVHDTGVAELARLGTLRDLNISASASEEAFNVLRRKLPDCKLKSHGYSKTRAGM